MVDLKKTESITLRVEMSSWTDRKGETHEGLSIREFVSSKRYTGPGKNGVFIPKELLPEFKKAVEKL